MPTDANENKQYWWRREAPTPPASSVHYMWQSASNEETTEETAVSNPAVCLLTTPKPGDTCPTCNQGKLAYDGLFILTCEQCGYIAESGCFS
ncbi:MAG: hypothetical protein R3E31_13670 [Chloroflexota bacterium]